MTLDFSKYRDDIAVMDIGKVLNKLIFANTRSVMDFFMWLSDEDTRCYGIDERKGLRRLMEGYCDWSYANADCDWMQGAYEYVLEFVPAKAWIDYKCWVAFKPCQGD